MAVLNYSTTIPAYKTVAEVEYMLMQHGATAVMKTFEDGRRAGERTGNMVTRWDAG